MIPTHHVSSALSRRSLLLGATGASLGVACNEAALERPAPTASASAAPAPDLAKLAASGDLGFALALYGQAAQTAGNVAFSPLALRVALAMVHAGARGQTKRELGDLLRLPEGSGLEAMGALQQYWVAVGETTAYAERALERSRDPDPVVFRTNATAAAWVSKHRPLHEAYAKRLAGSLDARIESVDFADAAATAEKINAWSDEATRHYIPSFVEPADLVRLELLLTSAVWMHARWKRPFIYTVTDTFHLSAAKSVQVEMFTGDAYARYTRAAGVQVLELPYWEDLASMLVVLPEGHGLADLESSLDEATVRSWRAKLEPLPVRITMPEFEVAVKSPVGAWLKQLGVESMFDDRADLSGIASGPLRVSAVRHSAKIRTDKVGTKLAGIADVAVAISRVGTNEKSPVFRADRPFLYFVVDRRHGSTLFMGRVADPRS